MGVPEFVFEAGSPALCRADPEAYFADGVRAAQARRLCAGCSDLEACRSWALERPGVWGVWGGTTRLEREALRRRQRADGERGPPAR